MLNLKGFLGLDGSGWELGLKKADSLAHRFTHDVSSELKSGLVGAFGAAALEEANRRIIEYGEHVFDTSQRLSESTDEVQKWEYALKHSGASTETAVSFLERLATARDKALAGDPGARGAFSKLGVSEGDLRNKRISDLGVQIGNTIKQGDAQQFIGALREIGGRGAGELVAAFKEGLEEKFENAVKLGMIIPPETIAQLKMAGENMTNFGTKLKTEIAPFAAALAQTFRAFAESWFAVYDTAKAFLSTLIKTKSLWAAIFSGDQAWNAAIKEMNEKDKHFREMVERAKNGGGPQAPNTETNIKDAEERLKKREHEYKIQEKINELSKKNDREMMTEGEKLNALIKERNELLKSPSVEDQLKAEELRGEINKTIRDQSKVKAKIQLTPLEQIGAKISFRVGVDPLQRALMENTDATKTNTDSLKRTTPPEGFKGQSDDNTIFGG